MLSMNTGTQGRSWSHTGACQIITSPMDSNHQLQQNRLHVSYCTDFIRFISPSKFYQLFFQSHHVLFCAVCFSSTSLFPLVIVFLMQYHTYYFHIQYCTYQFLKHYNASSNQFACHLKLPLMIHFWPLEPSQGFNTGSVTSRASGFWRHRPELT